MKALSLLLRIANFRLEQLEQQRIRLVARIRRLNQSRDSVLADLQGLQKQHLDATSQSGNVLHPTLLVAMRQIWIEAQERQTLIESMEEQLASLTRNKRDLDQRIEQAWRRRQALDRAIDLQAHRQHLERMRKEFQTADDLWEQRAIGAEKESVA